MYWVKYIRDGNTHQVGPFRRFMEADEACWNIYLDYSVRAVVTTQYD